MRIGVNLYSSWWRGGGEKNDPSFNDIETGREGGRGTSPENKGL